MTYDQALTLKKGDPIIYKAFHGAGYSEEVKFVKIDYQIGSQHIIIVCVDSWDQHRWGYLDQYTLFPSEF